MGKQEQTTTKTTKFEVGFKHEEVAKTISNDEPTEVNSKEQDNKIEPINTVPCPVSQPDKGGWNPYMTFMVVGGSLLFLIIIGLAILAIVA